MLDSRFDPANKLYDAIKLIREVEKDFVRDASGHTSCLSTFCRDTLKHQLEILGGVADTINSLSNMMYHAEDGQLWISHQVDPEQEGLVLGGPVYRTSKCLTTPEYREKHGILDK